MIGALVGAALAIGSSIAGGISANKKAKKAKAELAAQEARDDAWYRRRYNEDYADTATGQHLITQAKEYAKSISKKAEGSAAITGASDASVALAKDAGNKVVGSTLANIASTDETRKMNVDNIHHSDQQNTSKQRQAIYAQEAQNATTAAQNASNAALQAGVAYDYMKSPSVVGTTTTPSVDTIAIKSPVNTASTIGSVNTPGMVNAYYKNYLDNISGRYKDLLLKRTV